ncbi:MAG TPA: PAS domain S-box protein [Methanoregula sp.]|nr:PAS domain S-box protein [Methanoregula sp.]
MVTKKKTTAVKKVAVAKRSTSPLHDAAEKKLARSPPVSKEMKGQPAERLIHELQVHQIELEVQADELLRAQLALTESLDQYLDLYEFAPLGYLTLTDTALISQANLTAAGLFCVERTRLVNAGFREWIVPEDLETWDRYFTNLLQSDIKLTAILMLKRGDETTFPARLERIRLGNSSTGQSIRVAISDISDLMKAEKAMRTNEDRIRLQARMLDAVGDAVIAVDTNRTIIFWNEAATRTYGWRPKEVIGRKSVDVIVPELSKEDAREISALLERGETWSGEYRVLHRDGHEFPVHVIDSPVFDDEGNLIAIIGASHDISEQIRSNYALRCNEEKLLRAQELLEAVTKGTDVIIAAQDLNFCYTFFNQAYKDEIKRLTGKDLTLGTNMVELFAEIPNEQKMAIKEWSKVMNGENVNQTIEFGDQGDNRRIYHVLHTPIRDADGTIVSAGEVAYDVIKHVQVEDKLRETKEYLDNLITYANAPIIVWDAQFHINRFNQAFEHLTGRKAKEVLGQHVEILLPDTYRATAMDLIKKTSIGGERWDSVEIPILHKKGGIRTVLWNSATIFGADGKTIVSTIAQGQDITDRKKIESEFRLRAKEYAKMNVELEEQVRQRMVSDTTLNTTLSLLSASLESTADGILVVDRLDKITSFNQNFVNMWNIPPVLLEGRENEKVAHHILPQLKNPEGFLASIKELQAHPTRESFDMVEFNDGKIFERYSKPQLIGDTVVGRVWSFRDITDRKHAEEKLVASLQEKEVLLREIHHRVKNNLQLISGLLDMTRMRTSDESTNSTLTDMMLKIETMAQIHTRLYESKQFGRISIKGQIQDQITALSNIYSHKGHEIACKINSDEVFLPVDQAIPCALVVNEILSNAYKHAFRERKHGMIDITVIHKDKKIYIAIKDDGIGMPDNFDVNQSRSLGLKLIRTLVQHQLKGTVKVNSRNGTEMIVDFPVMETGG